MSSNEYVEKVDIATNEEIDAWTPEERAKLCRLLAAWFPELPYSDEDMPGSDCVDAVLNLYNWAGGDYVEGYMPDECEERRVEMLATTSEHDD